jgi:hypothetical protein
MLVRLPSNLRDGWRSPSIAGHERVRIWRTAHCPFEASQPHRFAASSWVTRYFSIMDESAPACPVVEIRAALAQLLLARNECTPHFARLELLLFRWEIVHGPVLSFRTLRSCYLGCEWRFECQRAEHEEVRMWVGGR